MAVSKRLRTEIFRRDDHTCQYCGRKAPDVPITVDHVTPVALGGTDAPTNLVTACKDCNAGKSSIAPNSPLLARAKADALRWSLAMKQAAADLEADHQARLMYRKTFEDAWNGWTYEYKGEKATCELPTDWRQSIENFRLAGLPEWLLPEIVDTTMAAKHVQKLFNYFAGVAWKRIGEIQAAARAIVDTDAPELTWDERAEQAVISAAVHVWQTHWMPEHECEPPAELVSEFRKQAAAVYPERIGPDDLMRAAERVASWDELNLDRWTDVEFGDDYWNWAAYDAMVTWIERWLETVGEKPSRTLLDRVGLNLRAAVMAGYGELDIAAHCAATERSTEVVSYLDNAPRALDGLVADAAWVAAHGEDEGGES